MQAVFIDRDGTIGGNDEVTLPSDFQLYSFSKQAIALLKQNGIKIYAFTNQPDVSRGLCNAQDFVEELTDFGFDDVYLCPHQPSEQCKCRKPSKFLLEKAAKEHGLSLGSCAVIGDRWSDMLAGMTAGTKTVLVLTGAGHDALNKYRDQWHAENADYIAENLFDAVKWILDNKTSIIGGI